MARNETEIVRCGTYNPQQQNVDRNNGGHLWPFKNNHKDGVTGFKNATGQDYGKLYSHVKRGRTYQQVGCCAACQVCPCACTMPMITCVKPANLTGYAGAFIDLSGPLEYLAGSPIYVHTIPIVKKWYAELSEKPASYAPSANYGSGWDNWDTIVSYNYCAYDGGFTMTKNKPEYGPVESNVLVLSWPYIHASNEPGKEETHAQWTFTGMGAVSHNILNNKADMDTCPLGIVSVIMNTGLMPIVTSESFKCEAKTTSVSASGNDGFLQVTIEGWPSQFFYNLPASVHFSINWSPSGVIIAPATIKASLDPKTEPCSQKGGRLPRGNLIQDAIDDAIARGPVTMAVHGACGYTSELYPIPNHQGAYYGYNAGPSRSRNFPWNVNNPDEKCSSKWYAAFKVVEVSVKQKPIYACQYCTDIIGWSVLCLQTQTYIVSSGEVDSEFMGQYTCTKYPSFIPNSPDSYFWYDDGDGVIEEGEMKKECSYIIGTGYCPPDDCCDYPRLHAGSKGGVYLGESTDV